MKARRFSLTPCLLGCIVMIVLGLAALFMLGVSLPGLASESFGSPAPRLDMVQRMRLSVQLLLQTGDLTDSFNPLGAERPFRIELGETPAAIAGRLQSEGLIPNAAAFTAYLLYAGLDITMQAGDYRLSPAMTPIDIAHALQDATPGEVNFSVLSGWRLEEIAASIPTSGLEFPPQDFLAATQSHPAGYSFLKDLPEEASLEGYLFPGAYRLPRATTVSELIIVLLNEFEAQLTPEIKKGLKRQGLNIHAAVTLASIIERESVVPDEMPLIASVFLNRLAIGMPLEADSTVQYAIGYNQSQETWWTNPLRGDDLQINSPYNTYHSPGLPPGPIANPSLNALRSVAFPAQTPYYYFRAACDESGKHVFTETYAEHLANQCP